MLKIEEIEEMDRDTLSDGANMLTNERLKSLLAMSRKLLEEIEHHEIEAQKEESAAKKDRYLGYPIAAGYKQAVANYHLTRLAAMKGTEEKNEK